MDMAAITAAQASIKALFGLAKVATSAAVDHEVKARLIDIQAAILDAQAKLGDAQAERLELLHQVAELKERVRVFESARDALGQYQLHEIGPGKFLYKHTNSIPDGIEHFACPTCFNAGKVTVVQSSKTGKQQTLYFCQTCKFQLFVGPSDPPRSLKTRTAWRSY